ncbi:MAG: tagaturonate epimerase family protein [Verrucomicrobiota bacterium]|nr:tagaturonate epimerase family protein [Verrucomicrobiota bacterium]
MKLEPYSMGIGDRFARQGKAQLQAFVMAREEGVEVTPSWNKSNREHTIIRSSPADVRQEADAAVQALKWRGAYRVDADHISLKTVDAFIAASDFFTLDVADFTGRGANPDAIAAFVGRHAALAGPIRVPGLAAPVQVGREQVRAIAAKHLLAVQEAGKIYRHIESRKGPDRFVTEVSLDETDRPQTPVEMLFILAAIADEEIPVQTIAPKFTGRFNKGVDYVGDAAQFAREFEDDLRVIAFAVKEFGLPAGLKLSVHSGSDKFSLYEPIRKAIRKHKAGLHLKTAGTTWLEELIGLAEAGGDGLQLAKEIYRSAHGRFDELCGPYAAVIDINRRKLPAPAEVNRWTGARYVKALRHDPSCKEFNPNFRQLLHVGYKVAAELGPRYLQALDASAEVIGRNVTENVYSRHLRMVFG